MATIKTGSDFAFDMTLIDVGDLGDIVKSGPSLIRTADDSKNYTDFKGSFTFSGDDVTGGTLTAITNVVDGSTAYAITGLSVDAKTFYQALVDGDTQTALELVLSGNDRVTGSALADVLFALDGNDSILGRGGDDALFGFAGNDRLDGGSGGDLMQGLNGNDTYYVDDKHDLVSELSIDGRSLSTGHDTVMSSVIYMLGDGLEDLKLTGSRDIDGYGNALKNSITGNSGDNVLDGGAGADTLIGGKGDDQFMVDNRGDKVVEASRQGDDTIVATASHVLEKYIENLRLDGDHNINGRGNDGDNDITGNGGKNDLRGLKGDDTIAGGDGRDTLIGGAGKDWLTGGDGNDRFAFGKHDFSGKTSGKADVIQDFQSGDKIDLSSAAKGFSFIGTDAFDKHGPEIRVEYGDNKTVLFGDINGNGTTDFAIRLTGHFDVGALSSHDFIF